DQAAGRDGDAVGIAGEITQHFLRPAEGALAIDHPFAFAQWREISGEGFCMGELGMIAEELQLAGGISGGELLQEQSSEQARQYAYREEKVRAARDPAVASRANPPPGTIIWTWGWWL